MTRLRFLGGVNEVGRSSLLVQSSHTAALLDCGVAVNHETRFPMYISPKLFECIVLSHCHLDHIGATPIFFIGGDKKVLGTPLTKELSEIVELDFLKVTHGYLPFEVLEIRKMFDSYLDTPNGKKMEISDDFELSLIDSGHAPGGSQVYLRVDDRKILYTGDINLRSTRLLPGADLDYGRDVDVLIMEATYASVEHPNRNEVEREFVERCKAVVETGGTVLVPAFGVGRSQEILCVLRAHNFPYTVYIDGMARKVNEVLMRHRVYLADPKLFVEAVTHAKWMGDDAERKTAAESPGVIVTPAGMLKGGPASLYSRKVAKDKKNAIFLVSYQVEGTPGRVLQEKRVLPVGGEKINVKAKVQSFDFSSHCGKEEYIKILATLRPERAFIVHGSKENCNFLFNKCEELGIKGIIPELGKEYIV
ncbi:MAG: MBL fold metallo-hydrolase [Candidatus Bathyarchaeia archaeon]